MAAFLIIGVFHPIVIKTEHHIGVKAWTIFITVELFCIAASLFIAGFMLSGIVGVFGFACLWSIRELYEQVERVEKSWFPAKPNCKRIQIKIHSNLLEREKSVYKNKCSRLG